MLFFLFISALLTGQREFDDERNLPDSILQQQLALEIYDSLELNTFYLDDIYTLMPFKDSILDHRSLQYNPIYEQDQPYIFLGNNGSAAIQINQLTNRNSGFDLGFHAYDLYAMNLDSFKWLQTNKAFSDLFFSNGPSAEEFRVKAKFAMNYPGGWNLNIDYERIIENGYYKNQATKQSSISTGIWHQSGNNRSNTFITYIGNIHQEENNGGISDTSYFSNSNYNIREVIPVNLSDAVLRLQNNQFSVVNHYKLSFKPDSVRDNSLYNMDLVSKLSYENGFLKYTDEKTSSEADSLYYSNLLVDDIGIRHYISYDKFSLSPSIEVKYNQRAKLRFGLAYDLWILNQEPVDSYALHDVYTFTSLSANIFPFLKINGEFDYHFANFNGDNSGRVNGIYSFKDYFNIQLEQSYSSTQANLIEQGFYISNVELGQTDFKKVLSSTTKLEIASPYIGSTASVSLNSIDNFIYYDPQNFFIQPGNTLNILDFNFKQKFGFKGFNMDLDGHLFIENNDIIDIPEYTLFSKLYYAGPILNNKLQINTGFEFRLFEGFFIPSYQAAVGKFYPQNDFASQSYPILNFYIGFKVDSFRFFARTENILNAFSGDVHFLNYLYPQNDFKAFRMGIMWQFID